LCLSLYSILGHCVEKLTLLDSKYSEDWVVHYFMLALVFDQSDNELHSKLSATLAHKYCVAARWLWLKLTCVLLDHDG
jgi:hypothetical protein